MKAEQQGVAGFVTQLFEHASGALGAHLCFFVYHSALVAAIWVVDISCIAC